MSDTKRGNAEFLILGPDGELGYGAIGGPQLRRLLLLFWLPTGLLLFFAFGVATVAVWLAALYVAFQLARLIGTPALVKYSTSRALKIFGAASAAFLVVHWLLGALLGSNMMYVDGLYVLGILGVFGKGAAPLCAAPPKEKMRANPATLAELQEFCKEIATAQAALRGPSLPIFDETAPELVSAWLARDATRIAELLQEGNDLTEAHWKEAIIFYNEMVANVDRARWSVLISLGHAQQRLTPYNLDNNLLDLRNSKYAHMTFKRAVPYHASVKSIDMMTSAFWRGAGNAMGRGITGQVPAAFVLAAVSATVIAGLTYYSRLLRRLKDVEGQLKANAVAARGDFGMIASLLETRVGPQLRAMVDVIERLEQGTESLPSEPSDAAREQALRLSLAVREGCKLVGTLAGN
ncbi:MAG: hypothetical protein JSR60_18600 [Proteobacteria bacterium]|nr:hypothetical protein [Pseudomonadota bacterium]